MTLFNTMGDTTSARGANRVWEVSRAIRRNKDVFPLPTPRWRTIGGLCFQLGEDVVRRFQKNAGEELVFVATPRGEVEYGN